MKRNHVQKQVHHAFVVVLRIRSAGCVVFGPGNKPNCAVSADPRLDSPAAFGRDVRVAFAGYQKHAAATQGGQPTFQLWMSHAPAKLTHEARQLAGNVKVPFR